MAAAPNIFWKTAIDFRDFDISVPSFTYQNDVFRSIARFNDSPAAFDDQLILNAGAGGQNDWFLGTDITRSGQTVTGGTLGMYVDKRPGGFDGYIQMDGGRPITGLNAAMDSVSTADDIAFLRNVMLNGDDRMELSGGLNAAITNDYAFGANGNDTIYGNGGDDTLLGDAGNDLLDGDIGNDSLMGGTGADSLYGFTGADFLFGGKGLDSLFGGNGVDRLRGDAGNDFLTGGNGQDQFVFRKGHGSDTIVDWQDGIDKIRIEAPGSTNVGTFVETQVGADCVITNTTLNIEITILNTNKNQISLAGDFLLVGF